MASVTLMHDNEGYRVPSDQAMAVCTLFQNDPALATAPYPVRSSVPPSSFRQFVSAIQGDAVEITAENACDLSLLCQEFGFAALAAKISFHEARDLNARRRISALEDWAKQRDRELAILRGCLAQLRDSALGRISRLEEDYARLSSRIPGIQTCTAELRSKVSVLAAWTGGIDSVILSDPRSRHADLKLVLDFPDIFGEFQGKALQLLWRGSRDGFKAAEFHRRCDGHPNTVTVIRDVDGNVFGGFTPVEWESRLWNQEKGERNNRWKGDDSLKSFIFTLKNPHNIAARKFALKPEKKNRAIKCTSEMGPHFCDFGVSSDCNANLRSNTKRYVDSFGFTYHIDTEVDGRILFTGSPRFQVKEIEVFEVTS
jgi:hypothetical protein